MVRPRSLPPQMAALAPKVRPEERPLALERLRLEEQLGVQQRRHVRVHPQDLREGRGEDGGHRGLEPAVHSGHLQRPALRPHLLQGLAVHVAELEGVPELYGKSGPVELPQGVQVRKRLEHVALPSAHHNASPLERTRLRRWCELQVLQEPRQGIALRRQVLATVLPGPVVVAEPFLLSRLGIRSTSCSRAQYGSGSGGEGCAHDPSHR
mmetsp:Transcript_3338/g.9787  ORF Transcript_3338/g.9787 Transcript_3338/m.9787 type:complete len:209 (-) Transcript_3338:27-653(-)